MRSIQKFFEMPRSQRLPSFLGRLDFWLIGLSIAAFLIRIYHLDSGPYADEITWAELALRMHAKDFQYIVPRRSFLPGHALVANRCLLPTP